VKEKHAETNCAVDHLKLPQDLHIHTTYSTGDSAVSPEMTIALVKRVAHARIVGISDHFEYLVDGAFERYAGEVGGAGFKLGVEVDGHAWAQEASAYPVDYYLFHCRDQGSDYRALEVLLATGKPLIIAHPNAFGTVLRRVPPECLVEINNRYVWRSDWRSYYSPFRDRFRFVIGSDAHQPNWLGQAVARRAAAELGIQEQPLF
jgi:histidinol phosphatase-like PHP family hydrolase